MKTKLFFTLLSFLISTIAFSQVMGGQVDDFEDGTTQLWSEGGASTNPPINIATGGPSGVNDNYLQNDSSGMGTGGSRMVMFNSNIRWGGNYTSAGILAITCDVRVSTNTLNLRVAMTGPGGRISSANSVVVAPSSNWTKITLPVAASDMALAGGTNIASTLTNVTEFRILSSTSPSWRGDRINARLEIDNISAVTTLSADDFLVDAFVIYPNPSQSKVNVELPSNTIRASIKVFDILGQQILAKTISKLDNAVDASSWKSGMYLINAEIEGRTQTKIFVKQ